MDPAEAPAGPAPGSTSRLPWGCSRGIRGRRGHPGVLLVPAPSEGPLRAAPQDHPHPHPSTSPSPSRPSDPEKPSLASEVWDGCRTPTPVPPVPPTPLAGDVMAFWGHHSGEGTSSREPAGGHLELVTSPACPAGCHLDVTTRELLIPKLCGVPECPRSIFLLRPLFEVNSRGLGTASHPAPRPRVTFSRRVAPHGRAPAAGA